MTSAPTLAGAPDSGASSPAPLRGVGDIPSHQVGLPIIGPTLAYRRDPFGFHLGAYRQHGPIYRTYYRNREYVVLAGLEANDFVWRNTDVWDYGSTNLAFGEQLGSGHVTQLDGEPHRNRRKALKPAFGMDAIMRYLPVMDRVIATELAGLPDGRANLAEFFGPLLIRVTSQTSYRADLTPEMVRTFDEFEHQFLFGTNLGLMRHVYYNRPRYLRLKSRTYEFFRELLEARSKLSTPPADNMTAVIQANADAGNEPLSQWELENYTYLILIAGVHNTANLLYWCLMYLWSRPDWLEALREEVAAWDMNGFRGMQHFPKLKATIQEVMRLRPGAITLPRHAGRDFEFAGYRVPAGTRVLHANTLVHFLEEVYEKPLEFQPERFLGGRAYPPKANGFFGGGTHICLGMNLSMIHTPVALANVVRDYDIQFACQPSFEVTLDVGGNRMREHVPVQLVRRARP
jgi:cytochrome P450